MPRFSVFNKFKKSKEPVVAQQELPNAVDIFTESSEVLLQHKRKVATSAAEQARKKLLSTIRDNFPQEVLNLLHEYLFATNAPESGTIAVPTDEHTYVIFSQHNTENSLNIQTVDHKDDVVYFPLFDVALLFENDFTLPMIASVPSEYRTSVSATFLNKDYSNADVDTLISLTSKLKRCIEATKTIEAAVPLLCDKLSEWKKEQDNKLLNGLSELDEIYKTLSEADEQPFLDKE